MQTFGGGVTAIQATIFGVMPSSAQSPEALRAAVIINHAYDASSNIPYGVANNFELQLDVYHSREARSPAPVGPNLRDAVSRLGTAPEREDVARRISPLAYVRSGLPPILTLHGDADKVVPYLQAVRLHEAPTKAGVRNQLLTITGDGHERLTAEQDLLAFETSGAFLESLQIRAVNP